MKNITIEFVRFDGTTVTGSYQAQSTTYPTVSSSRIVEGSPQYYSSPTNTTLSLVENTYKIERNIKGSDTWYIDAQNNDSGAAQLHSGSHVTGSIGNVLFNICDFTGVSDVGSTVTIKPKYRNAGFNGALLVSDTVNYTTDGVGMFSTSMVPSLPYEVTFHGLRKNTVFTIQPNVTGSIQNAALCIVTSQSISNNITPANNALYGYTAAVSDLRYAPLGGSGSNTTASYILGSNVDGCVTCSQTSSMVYGVSTSSVGQLAIGKTIPTVALDVVGYSTSSLAVLVSGKQQINASSNGLLVNTNTNGTIASFLNNSTGFSVVNIGNNNLSTYLGVENGNNSYLYTTGNLDMYSGGVKMLRLSDTGGIEAQNGAVYSGDGGGLTNISASYVSGSGVGVLGGLNIETNTATTTLQIDSNNVLLLDNQTSLSEPSSIMINTYGDYSQAYDGVNSYIGIGNGSNPANIVLGGQAKLFFYSYTGSYINENYGIQITGADSQHPFWVKNSSLVVGFDGYEGNYLGNGSLLIENSLYIGNTGTLGVIGNANAFIDSYGSAVFSTVDVAGTTTYNNQYESVNNTTFTLSYTPIQPGSVSGTYYDNNPIDYETYYDGGDGLLYSNYDNHVVGTIDYTTGVVDTINFVSDVITDANYTQTVTSGGLIVEVGDVVVSNGHQTIAGDSSCLTVNASSPGTIAVFQGATNGNHWIQAGNSVLLTTFGALDTETSYFYTAGNLDSYVGGSPVFRLGYAGSLAFGSSYYAIDPGANNAIFEGQVGIGVTAPVNTLDVSGNISCSLVSGSLHGASYIQLPYSSSAQALTPTVNTGSMYVNTATNLLYVYNGTAWKSASLT